MTQLAGGPSGLRDCRNRVLEDQLILRTRFEQQGKLVKALNAAEQFRAVDQIDRHRGFLAPRKIQKTILDVLWCLLWVHETIFLKSDWL